ncbi:hypothetical protein FGF1_14780 [Flavobacteriaceae bacterium GF1]
MRNLSICLLVLVSAGGLGQVTPSPSGRIQSIATDFVFTLSDGEHNRPLIRTGWSSDVGDYLHLKHGGNNTEANTYGLRVSDAGGFDFGKNDFANSFFKITTNGNIGIGTPAPTAKLDLRGDFYMDAGEGFRVFGDVNYFGEWRDGIVFEMRDGNLTNGGTDGGFVFRGYTPTDNAFKDWMVIRSDGGGRVGIGTTNPDAKLAVKGDIHAQEVKVDLNGAVAPDYVFKEDYDLRSLQEVQDYIKKHGHLPNIPSAQEMEANGIDLGQMNLKLLEKIEELTLYIIALEQKNKKIQAIEERLNKMEQKINTSK